MACRLYAGLVTLTQTQANRQCALWVPIRFADLNEAVEASWRLDHAVPRSNVPWVIECDDGQRLEHSDIRQRYRRPKNPENRPQFSTPFLIFLAALASARFSPYRALNELARVRGYVGAVGGWNT